MKTPALLIMAKLLIYFTFLTHLFSTVTFAIQPVLVADYIIDTSLYVHNFQCNFAPAPTIDYNEMIGTRTPKMLVWAFRKKNSNEIDIYSYTGKCGTSVFPVFKNDGEDYKYYFFLSCYFVDNDPQWETIVRKDGSSEFILYDDDGTEIMRDSGDAGYGFDGVNTYIISLYPNSSGKRGMKTWRLRSNLSTESPKSLAKTKSVQSSPMQIYGLSGGDYRVTLSPSSGNQINFQMFDLLGRCVFDKMIQNLTSPVSFTVSEANVPNSPFIAKVSDGNGSVVKKQIPVK